MGSKVSGKMAAAGRVVQVIKPHAPLIKFPNRQSFPRPNVQEALKIAVARMPESLHSSPPYAASAVKPTSRVPGPPDSAATIRDFPQRYRRRPLALDEMDYIQRGGPE